MPRTKVFVVAIASGVLLSSCTTSSSPRSHAVTHFSIRQVYESSDTGLTGTEIGDTPASAGETSGSPTPPSVETTPSPSELSAYAALDCSTPANQQGGIHTDDPAKFLATCGNPDGSPAYFKYLLRPSVIRGTDILAASAELDVQTGTEWTLQLTFKPDATSTWSTYTASHVGTAVAITVDGNVLVAEVIQGEIVGPTQIDGAFTKKSASDLTKELNNGNVR